MTDIISGLTSVYIGGMVFTAISLFAVFPLFLGLVRYFCRINDGITDNPVGIFYYFSNVRIYEREMFFAVNLFLRLVFSAWILLIPYLLLNLFANSEVYDFFGIQMPLWSTILSTIGDFALFIAVIAFVIINLKYYLSVYIFASSNEINGGKALGFSVTIARRTRMDFLFLCFSMIGYIILSVLFVPLLFTLPFIIEVYTVHSRCAVNEYNEIINSLKMG